MSAELYYFSGTGNSLVVARDLAAALGDATVIPIPQALAEGRKPTADCVGIIFPVYMWGPPLIVSEFARRLDVSPETYIFAVATYGGFPAGTLGVIDRILRGRSRKLSAGFGVLMPGNYTPMYGAPPEEKQAACFAKEKERIGQIASTVRQRQAGRLEGNNMLANFLFTTLLYRVGSPHIPSFDRKFRVTERCNGCGVCAKVCPVGNIDMRDGKPVWRGHTEHCMACLQWCPQEAIEFGAKTAGRRRYHHPEVRAADIGLRRP